MNHAARMDTAHPPRSPFHAGEQALQARAGVRERIERTGRAMIRDFMPDQHREFFAAQPLIFVGSLDARGRPWASMLTGDPGFMASPDARTLRVNALPVHGDPLASNLAAGAPLGLLGIELESRRRNRANGTVTRLYQAGFELRVEQSFGNCPQYIQARSLLSRVPGASPTVRAESQVLSERAQALVRRADTFFIATAAPAAGAGNPVEGVDVSHRGGKPGFVHASLEAGRSVLTAPDFRGNFLFNTFGNLLLNPRAALLFVDFDSGDLLSLTGEAEVLWDAPELVAFAGAQRLLRFRVEEGRWLERASSWRWSSPVPAPQLAATGSWDEPG
jgi:predicted pyridoxine 5'-phosphate oxidase superfamily flavin-nucleotide-binding protein